MSEKHVQIAVQAKMRVLNVEKEEKGEMRMYLIPTVPMIESPSVFLIFPQPSLNLSIPFNPRFQLSVRRVTLMLPDEN